MSDYINVEYFKHPYAEFILGSYQSKLCICDFRYRKMRESVDQRIKNGLKCKFSYHKNDQILIETRKQLTEYFLRKRTSFDIPLLMVGTEFQKKLWIELEKIPYGSIVTYSYLAQKLGDVNCVRAVGNANGANSIAIIVPCHRVINSNGSLGGFGGGVLLKEKLLKLEQKSIFEE